MREILFRGKRKDNGEWICGDLVHWWGRHNTKPDIQIYNNVQRFNIIPETVGQYTGLTDKNGTKIFEGDIVKNDNGMKTSVEFYRGRYYPFIAFPEFRCWDEEECEVIGNIHDNPRIINE